MTGDAQWDYPDVEEPNETPDPLYNGKVLSKDSEMDADRPAEGVELPSSYQSSENPRLLPSQPDAPSINEDVHNKCVVCHILRSPTV